MDTIESFTYNNRTRTLTLTVHGGASVSYSVSPSLILGFGWSKDSSKHRPNKLTAPKRKQLLERFAAGEKASVLASEFGVTTSNIYYLARNRQPNGHT